MLYCRCWWWAVPTHLPNSNLAYCPYVARETCCAAEGSFFDDKPFANVIFNPANLYPLMDAGGVPRYERSSETESFEALADAEGGPAATRCCRA